jgi:hypothetical protein
LAERTITFRQRKTDAVIKIPIHPDLEHHLLSLVLPSQDDGGIPVFPNLIFGLNGYAFNGEGVADPRTRFGEAPLTRG